jgi:hypothetical protein
MISRSSGKHKAKWTKAAGAKAKKRISKVPSHKGLNSPNLNRNMKSRPRVAPKRKKIQLVLWWGFIRKTKVPINI